MIKVIILYTGYVESAKVGHVLFAPIDDSVVFEIPVEAVKNLVTEFFNAWYEYEKSYSQKYVCCKKIYRDANFCSKCGKSLLNSANDQPSEEDYMAFRDYIYSLPGLDVDSFHVSEELPSWTPWTTISQILPIEKNELVEVFHAEELVAAILSEEVQKKFCDRQVELGKEKLTFDEYLANELEDRSM